MTQHLWRPSPVGVRLVFAAVLVLVAVIGSAGQPGPAPASLAAVSPLTEVSPLPVEPNGPAGTGKAYVPLIAAAPPPWAHTYYVDSAAGSDSNNCRAAENPATPKQTVAGVMACNPGPGATVRFRGVFTETLIPPRSGSVLYEVQDIAGVEGSVVTFNAAISNTVSAATDYVAIYGSRKGNSGAFPVAGVVGGRVSVDTSPLPGSRFVPESAADPGDLQAAILRPVHFTAWDRREPPVWNTQYQAYQAYNTRVIMLSYLKSIAGEAANPGSPVWGAFKIDGEDGGNSDFQIFDHLEVTNAECAIAIESHEFQSNYDILQYNNLHDIGTYGTGSDEIIYFGFAYRPDLHHDFAQIMYNKVGPHNANADMGDGIEIKPSAHNATVFGNEITGINAQGCDDAPLKIDGGQAFVANNYLHDIAPARSLGCGISIVDGAPADPTSGGAGTIVANNIVAHVRGVGIRIIDADDVQVLNNTVYDIPPEPNCDEACREQNAGIAVQNWQGSTERTVIKNNVVQGVHIGIGRYIWSHDEPVSIDSDYNLVYDAVYPFRGPEDAPLTQNEHDLVANPGLADPQGGNFTPGAGSPAHASGLELTGVLDIDNHNAAAPGLPARLAPILRSAPWDRGAFQASLGGGAQ